MYIQEVIVEVNTCIKIIIIMQFSYMEGAAESRSVMLSSWTRNCLSIGSLGWPVSGNACNTMEEQAASGQLFYREIWIVKNSEDIQSL